MSQGIDNAVGMMDGAYFTSRSEILEFLNDLLQMNLSKIEQTASGAVACQLVEYMFPGSIPMKRVNWEAKSSHEFIQNYKLLQAAFSKKGVQRYVDVDKLIRAKYQDNLEFCQWLKAFYDMTNPPIREGYDPVAIRAKGKGGRNLPDYFDCTANKSSKKVSRPTTSARPSVKSKTPLKGTTTSDPHRKRTTSTASTATSGSSVAPDAPKGTSGKVKRNDKTSSSSSMFVNSSGVSGESIVADANLMKLNADLEMRNAQLLKNMNEMEKERDFYFEKLRDVEMLLQIHQEKKMPAEPEILLQRLFQVLYATADEGIVVDETSGELLSHDAPYMVAQGNNEIHSNQPPSLIEASNVSFPVAPPPSSNFPVAALPPSNFPVVPPPPSNFPVASLPPSTFPEAALPPSNFLETALPSQNEETDCIPRNPVQQPDVPSSPERPASMHNVDTSTPVSNLRKSCVGQTTDKENVLNGQHQQSRPNSPHHKSPSTPLPEVHVESSLRHLEDFFGSPGLNM